MSQAIIDTLDRLDQQRRDFLARLDAASPDELAARPATDRWSLIEVAEHLVRAERAILGGLCDPASLVAQPRGLRQRLKRTAVRLVVRTGVRVDVPSDAMRPSGAVTLDRIREEWQRNHDWLRRFITDADDAVLGAPCFHHPIAGPLTIGEALDLGASHIATHARKVDAIRRRAPAPAG